MAMRFHHTNRPGFWLGFIDFFTAGLFFLLYMPLGDLQDELDYILDCRTQRFWVAYLLGIPTAFIYPLIWMSRIAEELKAKAIEMGIDGPYTSWWHMFGWNVFGKNGTDGSNWALFLTVGFCGGFTTFSTFSKEAIIMLQTGHVWGFAAYVSMSVVVGVALVALGYFLVR
jgi:hypothetical protein